MEKEVKQPENNGEEMEKPDVVRDESGKVISGVLNPNGRPKGAENFKTVFEKALKKLAVLNGKEADDLYEEIISKGITSARSGDYRFYKDLLDRLYGQPKQTMDVTSDGEKLTGITVEVVTVKNEPKTQGDNSVPKEQGSEDALGS